LRGNRKLGSVGAAVAGISGDVLLQADFVK